MQVGVGIVHPATAVRDLGVLLDSDLTNHISNVTSICFCQLRRLHQVSHLVRLEVTAQRVSSFMLSRPDYCNSVLHRHTHWHVLKAAARLRPFDHVTPSPKQLH